MLAQEISHLAPRVHSEILPKARHAKIAKHAHLAFTALATAWGNPPARATLDTTARRNQPFQNKCRPTQATIQRVETTLKLNAEWGLTTPSPLRASACHAELVSTAMKRAWLIRSTTASWATIARRAATSRPSVQLVPITTS